MNQLGPHAGSGQDINLWLIVAAEIEQPVSTQGTARCSIELNLAGDRIRYHPSAESAPTSIIAINRGETVVLELGSAPSIVMSKARQPAFTQTVEAGQRAFVHNAKAQRVGVLKRIGSKDFHRAGHGQFRGIGVSTIELGLFSEAAVSLGAPLQILFVPEWPQG